MRAVMQRCLAASLSHHGRRAAQGGDVMPRSSRRRFNLQTLVRGQTPFGRPAMSHGTQHGDLNAVDPLALAAEDADRSSEQVFHREGSLASLNNVAPRGSFIT